MAWTSEQQNAISARDGSILVSAAAGSGKTAVLVERICSRILDTENPVDIDEFLVVTFTKAAAAQMRDKISARLFAELEKTPENEHLMRQTLLINKADITTIDSFCLRIVKEHFSLLDIDSDFTIGDKGQAELLKADVLDELFEERYGSEDEAEKEDFYQLVNIFGGDRDDSELKKLILRIFQIASGYPKPESWLKEAKDTLMAENENDLENTAWVKGILKYAKNASDEALSLLDEAEKIAGAAKGPYKNIENCNLDREIILSIGRADSYGSLCKAIGSISWPRLKSCKGDEFDDTLVNNFKSLRENYKELVKTLDICKTPVEDVLSQIKLMRKYLVPLIELAESFSERLMNAKKERRIMEFSDIEHMAYRLVCKGYESRENGERQVIPTETGEAIGERYREIYIDEYQDSNYLQEDILLSVSGVSHGMENLFMVGDVKQSIYRFRMARPDLFISKYNRFEKYADDCCRPEVKIELKNNFRSRDVVLNAVNYFFYQLMGENLGGIDYTPEVALVPSKSFPEPEEEKQISQSTEILIADINEPYDEAGDEEAAEKSKQELEAVMIANRIEEILNPENPLHVFDEDLNSYRAAECRDIVILLRSMKGYGDIIYNTLAEIGIPAYIEEPEGYFEATEIRVVMALLSVIDNSIQDIPLSAALLSPVAGLSENELAAVCGYAEKKLKKRHTLYEKCFYYMEDISDGISEKLDKFFNMLGELKQDKITMSISELLLKVYDVTGYYNYASAMPAGERRRCNLDTLVDKARKFENGTYKGLFNFLRYIDKLKVNSVDFGESGKPGEDENVVRIMTMHKSKGLEYPIVFVSGLGKAFNMMDMRANVMLHSDYYISSKVINTEKRYRKKSVMREAVALLTKQETVAEELRILYVAMTRAKEKLILTGYIKEYEEYMSKLPEVGCEKILLPYNLRNTGKGFLSWILAAMKRYDGFLRNGLTDAKINLKVTDASTLFVREAGNKTDAGISIEEFIGEALSGAGGEAYQSFKESFDYIYPYEQLTRIKSKMSISEIKKMKAYDGVSYDVSESLKTYDDKQPLTGTERGTIVHKFMELLDFAALGGGDYISDIRQCMKKLTDEKIFTEEEISVVNEIKVNNMLMSNLGQRMIAAAKLGKLKKEQQFSMGIPVKEIYENIDSDDIVIVQGIIDAFFYEGDEIVLVDYKTDRADEAKLIGHYHAQLKYYASTLERLIGKKVKQKLIYSFYLNRVIEL